MRDAAGDLVSSQVEAVFGAESAKAFTERYDGKLDSDRIREAMELQAQTVTMITAAVDETALAADSMS